MLRSVRAFDTDSLTAVYECQVTEGGFLCGKCQAPQQIGLNQPCTCHVCGAQFSYHWEVNRADPEMHFGNTYDRVQPFMAASQQCVYISNPPSQSWDDYWGAEPYGRGIPCGDIGPTTACFDCGKIVPVGDVYYTSKRDERALCERCYGKAEKAGRAKCKT